MGRSTVVRRYQIMEGKNRYYFNGRCIGSRQIGVFLFALFLIVSTSFLFFIFDCDYLTRQLTVAIPIIGALLFIFVLVVLFRTACSDPGILPRSEKDEVLYNERQALIAMNQLDPSSTSIPPQLMINNTQMPRTKEVTVKGRTVKLKYCFTCKIYRPPRASHCSICDNCVERFDHHCPWVANCVGKRNYRFFYMFLVSLSLLCMYILACNIANLVLRTQEPDGTLVKAITATPATVVEGVICFFSMWSILCLCGYHTYLIGSEVSTNEDIKDSFSAKRSNHASGSNNPYDHGSIFSNFANVLCTSLPPSVIRLRETIPSKAFPPPLVGGGPPVLQQYHQQQQQPPSRVGSQHLAPRVTSSSSTVIPVVHHHHHATSNGNGSRRNSSQTQPAGGGVTNINAISIDLGNEQKQQRRNSSNFQLNSMGNGGGVNYHQQYTPQYVDQQSQQQLRTETV